MAAARDVELTYIPRGRDEVAAFFAGLEMVEPGVVPLLAWRPDGGRAPADPHSIYYWVGMGRVSRTRTSG